MKPNDDPRQQADEIGYLKRLLESEEVPERDYSNKITDVIWQGKYERTAFRPEPAKIGKRLALLIGIITLLSGFAYAGKEWLGLWDKSGQLVMRVIQTNARPLPDKQLRALEEISSKLTPGESAVVYFGSKEDILQNKTDQILWTQAPVSYTDWDFLLQALDGPLAQSRISIEIPDGYHFQKANLIYLHQGSQTPPPFVFGRSSEGLDYGYSTRQPSRDLQSVELIYQNEKGEIRYTIGANPVEDPITLFVEKPAKKAVVTVNGTEVYFLDNHLFWAEKGTLHTFDYTLSSPTASKQELVDFVQQALSPKP